MFESASSLPGHRRQFQRRLYFARDAAGVWSVRGRLVDANPVYLESRDRFDLRLTLGSSGAYRWRDIAPTIEGGAFAWSGQGEPDKL